MRAPSAHHHCPSSIKHIAKLERKFGICPNLRQELRTPLILRRDGEEILKEVSGPVAQTLIPLALLHLVRVAVLGEDAQREEHAQLAVWRGELVGLGDHGAVDEVGLVAEEVVRPDVPVETLHGAVAETRGPQVVAQAPGLDSVRHAVQLARARVQPLQEPVEEVGVDGREFDFVLL